MTLEIRLRFAANHGRQRSPRLDRELVAGAWRCSRRRVARLMCAAGLRANAVRIYRGKTGIKARYEQNPDRLRATRVMRPDQLWVSDITYLRVRTRWHISPSR